MPRFICVTCGTQFAESARPPRNCLICEDERQFVNWEGQHWTTLEDLQASHRNLIRAQGPGIFGIGSEPKFGIGQRALLVRTKEGNLLWDCISLIDDATFAAVQSLGGVAGIAVSHPHYYSCIVEWSERFSSVPIYLHRRDRQWVMRPDSRIHFWEGESLELFGGVTLICCGGHFAGGTVAHWGEGEAGQGTLLTGDIIQVVPDRRYVSFMRSFPNYIPLSEAAVRRISGAVKAYAFETIYGAWWDAIVKHDARSALQRSVDRYVAALREP